MLKLAGHRPAMKLAHCSAMLEKIEICVLPSCASLHRARDAKIDIFKLAGRRPAMKRSHKLAGRRLELKNATVCMLLIEVVHVSCEDENP